jgi:eukaryotic-like serine/threonine-protein kinase
VTAYPEASDYTLVLQNPGVAFTEASLRTATFIPGLGGPLAIPGSSAVVFEAALGGRNYALRCYTRDLASTPERYAALDGFVESSGLSASVGTVTWYEQAIKVNGAKWPVLKMDWIDGRRLDEHVGDLVEEEDSGALRALAGRWLELINELQRAGFAHGDLQHGNVLVDQQGQLRLVDFDSVWIPELQGQPAPTETGHPNYQPPGITAEARWGPHMDTFAGLVIYLALTALGKDPGLWRQFSSGGENMLFERDDFAPPYDTEIWKRLADLGDPDIDLVAAKLMECCRPGWVAAKTLEDTLKRNWWETPAGSAPTGAAEAIGTAATVTTTTAAAAAAAKSTAATPPGQQGKTAAKPGVASSASGGWRTSTPTGTASPASVTARGSSSVPVSGARAGKGAGTGAGAGTGDGKGVGAGASGKWWKEEESETKAKSPAKSPTPVKTAAKPSTGTASKPSAPSKPSKPSKGRVSPELVAIGVLLDAGGIATWITLALEHHPVRGAGVGLLFIFLGVMLGIVLALYARRKS